MGKKIGTGMRGTNDRSGMDMGIRMDAPLFWRCRKCVAFLLFLVVHTVLVHAQTIGEDKRITTMELPFFFPLRKDDLIRVSSGFGNRIHPISGRKKWHYGVDLVTEKGKPVFAVDSGVVQVAGRGNGYGYHVLISHRPQVKTLYAHLWGMVVRTQDKVQKGQLIGFVGDSGSATGPHLHYEVRLKGLGVDPLWIWRHPAVLARMEKMENQ